MNKHETKILITGATGMVGSHLAKNLTTAGYHVRASYRSDHPKIDGVEWVQADILDVVAMEEVLQDIQVVYHCAAQVSFDPKNAKSLYKNNVEGTANVVNACLGAKIHKLIYVSSVAAIGGNEAEIITENAIWNPADGHNEYAKTKHAAELEVRRGELEGLNVYIINPSIILGAGDWNAGSTELFKKIYNGFPYYTEGVHGFVDVLDVVKVLVYFLENENDDEKVKGERFILNGENISYKQLFDAIADGFSVQRPNKKVTPLLAEIVWRLSYLKGKITGKQSMLTRSSAHIAQADIRYSNKKILSVMHDLQFTPINLSVERICRELSIKNNLK